MPPYAVTVRVVRIDGNEPESAVIEEMISVLYPIGIIYGLIRTLVEIMVSHRMMRRNAKIVVEVHIINLFERIVGEVPKLNDKIATAPLGPGENALEPRPVVMREAPRKIVYVGKGAELYASGLFWLS